MNCQHCGKPIPKERAEALPDTKHCVNCADAHGPKRVIDVDAIVAKASAGGRNGWSPKD